MKRKKEKEIKLELGIKELKKKLRALKKRNRDHRNDDDHMMTYGGCDPE